MSGLFSSLINNFSDKLWYLLSDRYTEDNLQSFNNIGHSTKIFISFWEYFQILILTYFSVKSNV